MALDWDIGGRKVGGTCSSISIAEGWNGLDAIQDSRLILSCGLTKEKG